MKKVKKVYCGNCNKIGHTYRQCKFPITSYGIIAFRMVGPPGMRTYPEFMVIQRRDSIGYIDFLRNKHPHKKKVFLEEMTIDERERIATQKFDTLWDNLWTNHDSKIYKTERDSARAAFLRLDIPKMMKETTTSWTSPEWGFPKGRRNSREFDIDCAVREFEEEAGITSSEYVIPNRKKYVEEFKGSNDVTYKHVYFLAKFRRNCKDPTIDQTNKIQISEIGDIRWATFGECMKLFRPTQKDKKNLLEYTLKIMKQQQFFRNIDFDHHPHTIPYPTYRHHRYNRPKHYKTYKPPSSWYSRQFAHSYPSRSTNYMPSSAQPIVSHHPLVPDASLLLPNSLPASLSNKPLFPMSMLRNTTKSLKPNSA